MNYRRLGRTGLRVSEIGFGCGNVGGLMIRGEPSSRTRAVARALELGIDYFDTAPSYGDGQSERNLGQVFRELGAEAYVGTKVRLTNGERKDVQGDIFHSAEESLRRLRREYVDLIQLHNPITLRRGTDFSAMNVEEVLGEVAEAFQSLQRQGKVRFYGITALGETEAIHRAIEVGAFHTAQVCYNLLNPSAGVEVTLKFYAQDFARLIQRASETETGVIAIRVLAAGALSGVESRHPIAAPSVPPIASGPDYDEDLGRTRSFEPLVKEGYVESLVEASLRFVLSERGVSTALVGFSSIEQLEKAVEYASKGPLPRESLGLLPEVWNRW
ncbi:MAG: aldo/keto reductase [Chloroflexi bacterium]|nr:aldo/keto reductase [Chloroflexota bacterium]